MCHRIIPNIIISIIFVRVKAFCQVVVNSLIQTCTQSWKLERNVWPTIISIQSKLERENLCTIINCKYIELFSSISASLWLRWNKIKQNICRQRNPATTAIATHITTKWTTIYTRKVELQIIKREIDMMVYTQKHQWHRHNFNLRETHQLVLMICLFIWSARMNQCYFLSSKRNIVNKIIFFFLAW